MRSTFWLYVVKGRIILHSIPIEYDQKTLSWIPPRVIITDAHTLLYTQRVCVSFVQGNLPNKTVIASHMAAGWFLDTITHRFIIHIIFLHSVNSFRDSVRNTSVYCIAPLNAVVYTSLSRINNHNCEVAIIMIAYFSGTNSGDRALNR